MTTMTRDREERTYYVVHPLFDEPEEKADPDKLGPMHLSLGGKISLTCLRFYLILMIALAFYRVAVLAGVIH